MSIDYKLFNQQIVDAAGGFDNIKDISHCLTRLRISYNNIEKINEDSFKRIDGIQGYRRIGDQIQIIVGNDVLVVYKELIDMQRSVNQFIQEKKKITFQSIIQFVSDCMVQLFPGLVGCGMLKTLLIILTLVGFLSETSSTYIILYSFSDAFFYFLPLILGYSIAKKLDGNPVLYMCVGAALCYPSLVQLMDGSTLVLQSFHGISYTYLFGIPLICNTYPTTVLPMFLMSFIMHWVEKKVIGIGPTVIKPILGNVLFLLINIPIILFIIGPLGAIFGRLVVDISVFLYGIVPGVTIMALSILMPFIVASGMHYVFIPIILENIVLYGFDPVFGIAMFCSNIAQGGASLGVSIKTKDENLKSHGLTGFISSVLAGITEIAMYGVNFRYRTALYASMIAAGVGGLLSGILSLHVYQLGGCMSLITMVTFVKDAGDISGLYIGLLVAAVILVISFVLSFIYFKEEILTSDEIFPIKGEHINLSKVSNEVFASGIMGDGYGILPSDDNVYAPFDGIVESIYDTKHILFLKSNEGKRIMIHIGINSSYLEEDFFHLFIKEKDSIRKGQLMMKFDRKAIEAAGFNTETVIIYIEEDD